MEKLVLPLLKIFLLALLVFNHSQNHQCYAAYNPNHQLNFTAVP